MYILVVYAFLSFKHIIWSNINASFCQFTLHYRSEVRPSTQWTVDKHAFTVRDHKIRNGQLHRQLTSCSVCRQMNLPQFNHAHLR